MSRKAIFTPEEIKARRTARTLARRKWRRENEPGYQDGIRAGWRRWYANGNQQMVKDHVKRYRAENPHMAVYTNRKSNAKRMGKEFTIAFEDMAFPTHCPALGIELDYGKKRGRPEDNSPSFDRVDNDLGYIKGNVIVVSQLANRIKNSATPEQVIAVGEFYKKLRNSK